MTEEQAIVHARQMGKADWDNTAATLAEAASMQVPEIRPLFYKFAISQCAAKADPKQGSTKTAEMPASVVVESGAILGRRVEEAPDTQKLLSELVAKIRGRGWKCDTISSATTLLFSTGFSVGCNQFSYNYLIKDRGGRWVVTLD